MWVNLCEYLCTVFVCVLLREYCLSVGCLFVSALVCAHVSVCMCLECVCPSVCVYLSVCTYSYFLSISDQTEAVFPMRSTPTFLLSLSLDVSLLL